jgi:Pleckstrin homology domain
MSDEAKPVEQTPDAAPAAEAPVEEPAETTPAPAAAETAAPEAESKPTEEAPVTTEDKPAEAAETAAPAAPAEEKAAPKEAEPIYSGDLNFKGPANFPRYVHVDPKFHQHFLLIHRRNLFRQKTHFWFGEDEAVPTSKLGNFLKDSKAEHAHPAAAWSSQTGKGLLYYAKHKKDKEHPTGIILLVSSHRMRHAKNIQAIDC